MGHKVDPRIFRIGINKSWSSKWSKWQGYRFLLEEDWRIKTFLNKKLDKMGVNKIEIERSPHSVKVMIETSKPGLIIGRGGSAIEKLKEETMGIIKVFRKEAGIKEMADLAIEIMEIRKPDLYAAIVAEGIAQQLEKRMPFKRVLKDATDKVIQNKEVEGIKIEIAGRLGGAEMSRREWVLEGKIPLSTLRADIDYVQKNAYTTYGVIGIKVWIYKGEVF